MSVDSPCEFWPRRGSPPTSSSQNTCGQQQLTRSHYEEDEKMRNARPHMAAATISAATRLLSTSSTSPAAASAVDELSTLLAVASINKALTRHGPASLRDCAAAVSDPVVLRLLRRPSLPPASKLEFFRWAVSLPTYSPSAAAYAELICSLAHSQSHLDELLPLLRQVLSSTGPTALGLHAFRLSLDAFLLGGRFDDAIGAVDILEQAGGSPDPRIYNSIIRALLGRSQPDLALQVFVKLLEGSGSPDHVTCNELLVGLRRGCRREEFRKLFDDLSRRGYQFDTWGYNICIHAFGCWGELDVALQLFKEMKQKGPISDPDLCTYNSLIRALFFAGKVQEGLIAFEELKESGLGPDLFTYRSVIQGCCRTYHIKDAIRVFNEMEYNNIPADIVVYNSLLDGLFKAKKLNDACELFDKMVRDGIRMTSYSYNILISGLFGNRRSEAALELFCNLKKKGQYVDALTYSIVVFHLCRQSHVEEALELVEEMETRGFVVDLVTITSVLIGLHKKRRWDRAERLMKCVRDSSLVPVVLEWTANMEAMLRSPQDKNKDFTPMFPSTGDFSDVSSWLNGPSRRHADDIDSNDGFVDEWSLSPYMDQIADKSDCFRDLNIFFSSKGKRVQEKGSKSFDIDMINTYMSIFLSKGKLSVACKLFEIFTRTGRQPITYTYNAMLSTFVKKGYTNEAWGILQEMGEKSCPPDIATYNVIVQGLGKAGRCDLASEVIDHLENKGGYLDIVMYNTLINTLGKAGRLAEANKLFKQMTSSGISPDIITFNTLIEVHAKAGKVKDAYQFLRMMLDAGCSPNHVTDTILDFLEKEIERQRYEKASILHDKDKKSS